MSATPITDLPTVKRKIAVPFFTQVGANTGIGLSSDMVTFKYKVTKVEAHFTDDSASQLQVWAFVGTNRNVTTQTPMPDNKILGFYAPTPYLIGAGEVIKIDVDVTPAENERYLKVFFWNLNAYPVYGYCIITIETGEELLPSEIPSAVLKSDINYTPEEWLLMGKRKAQAVLELNLDVLSGTDPLYREQIEITRERDTTDKNAIYEQFGNLANFPNAIPPDIPKADILKTLFGWVDGVINLEWKVEQDMFLADLITGMLGGRTFDFKKWIEEIYGLKGLVHDLTNIGMKTAIFPQVEKYWNKFYTPITPNVSDLINMVVKEKLTVDEFKVYMREHGYSEDWSQLIWDAHFIAPDYQSVKRAYWRGIIPESEIDDYMKRVDLDPYYNDTVWKPLLEEIPPYSELVNERVKEVIPQDVFENALASWGFKGDWGKRIWDAHFSPATFSDFLLAMRRNETVTIPRADGNPVTHTFGQNTARDLEVIQELSVLADYDPRYWDFFKTRMYNDPTPRLARWAFETGDIPPERVGEIVHRFGYYPQDEDWITEMFVHFQERPYVTKYLTALESAYISEAISAEELTNRVLAIPRNKEIADWIITTANVKREILSTKPTKSSAKLLSDTDLKKAFSYDMISETDLRTELQLRGYTETDITLLINLVKMEKQQEELGGAKRGLTVAEYVNAWRWDELKETELKTELMLKGMSEREVDILMNTKKKQWGIISSEGGTS